MVVTGGEFLSVEESITTVGIEGWILLMSGNIDGFSGCFVGERYLPTFGICTYVLQTVDRRRFSSTKNKSN